MPIKVENLIKCYGDKVVLDNLSFSVDSGEIFGIIGSNGAGKTTLMECMEGLRQPDSGIIRVLGLDPLADHRELRKRIGVQLQESALPDAIKVIEVLELYASFYRNPIPPDRLLHDWDLADKRNTTFANLSGGQKQRLFVALALVGRPEVAFLDELTTGLDPQARRSTWDKIEAIRESGVTVVIVTHFMEEAERLCDRVMVLDGGRPVAIDSPSGLIADASRRRGVEAGSLDEAFIALTGRQETFKG